MISDHLCLVRGGGDLGTGVALQIKREGMPVAVCDLENPLAVRRKVSLSTAVVDKQVQIEEITGQLVENISELDDFLSTNVVPVLICESLPTHPFSVVVDARMQKKPLDTKMTDADLVIALGPGFCAGKDCHAVVETMRGPNMGKVIWNGFAEEDTGIPGEVGGLTSERLLRAPSSGSIHWEKEIGDLVKKGEIIGSVGSDVIVAETNGLIRGMINEGSLLEAGMKIGDIDPRGKDVDVCKVSDKALAVGNGVTETIKIWLEKKK
ncbi:MAG: selenium-dependent molybdenum cofactor biosynthesis protein YqeB [Actinomycetota bacterium]|nr:selenium-dependent molybdenum cofactor biosynthesis protein YqeB [Actinomycetota bacterium]